ncbi:MAG TPA: HD domain-containing protein [Anaerolineales bacterium]
MHGFDHVLRVLELAERLGRELGADLELLRAAALLHDAAGAAPEGKGQRGAEAEHEAAGRGEARAGAGRATHELDSAAFARSVLQAEGWPSERIEAVTHCIRAHRFRGAEDPSTLEAQVLFDADKLDVLGAFGVARTLGYALQADQPFFAEPSARFLETGALEPGEPHSAYHEYLFKLRHVSGRLHTEPARRLAERRHAVMKAFFEQLAAEAHGDI